MSTSWKPIANDKFSASLEDIELEAQHRAKWNSYCEHCREPLAGGDVWIKTSSGAVESEPSETYYCHACVSVNPGR